MADWNQPTLTSNYATGVIQVINAKLVDAVSLFNVDGTNIPENSLKFNRTTNSFYERISGLWIEKVLGITGGGTGSTTPAAARSNLGLGSLAIQNANAVLIIGGDITGLSSLSVSGNFNASGVITGNGSGLTTLNASNLTSGTVPTARLGSGTANSSVFLRGDSSWAAPSGTVPAGIIAMFDVACPGGWTRFSALDNKFPKGAAAYGATGGSSIHSHGGNTASGGNHSHGISGSTAVTSISHAHSFSGTTAGPNSGINGAIGGFDFGTTPSHTHDFSGSTAGADSPHSHGVGSLSIGSSGDHSHGIAVDNHEPPWLGVVWCKKD